MTNESAILVEPGGGQTLRVFGEEITILLTGEQTGGRFSVWHEITPPGGGPPLHFHINDDEAFYVLEGTIAFFQNSHWQEVGAGGSAFVPRGQLHTFKNPGAQSARMLLSTSPGGFDVFFTRSAPEFAKASGPDMARVYEIAAEYGIHFVAK